MCSDEDDDPFWLEEEAHQADEGHHFPAASPDQGNGVRAGALELNLADDPELARLGGIPPAERVFMYLQVRTSPPYESISTIYLVKRMVHLHLEDTVLSQRCRCASLSKEIVM